MCKYQLAFTITASLQLPPAQKGEKKAAD